MEPKRTNVPEALEIIDHLVSELKRVPNTDEQELANRIETRRMTLAWWIDDLFADREWSIFETPEGAL